MLRETEAHAIEEKPGISCESPWIDSYTIVKLNCKLHFYRKCLIQCTTLLCGDLSECIASQAVCCVLLHDIAVDRRWWY